MKQGQAIMKDGSLMDRFARIMTGIALIPLAGGWVRRMLFAQPCTAGERAAGCAGDSRGSTGPEQQRDADSRVRTLL